MDQSMKTSMCVYNTILYKIYIRLSIAIQPYTIEIKYEMMSVDPLHNRQLL